MQSAEGKMEGISHIDDLEAIEAELKECLQELSNEELSVAENKVVECQDHGTKKNVNLMAPESSTREGGMSQETIYQGFNDRTPPGDQGTESEKVTQWRLAFQRRVMEKDLQEEKANKLWREKAAQDLNEFYKRRADSKHGRVPEETQSSDVGGLGDCRQKNVWERVAELCDFDSKSKNVKDVSRMRSVIMSLKNSSESMEGMNPLQDPSQQ